MVKRTLRHPIRGDRRYPKPPRQTRRGTRRSRQRQPRMRPRKSVNVAAALVGSPEEEPSRPSLRLRVVGIAVLVLFGVLVVRLWTLQVIDAKTYAAQVTRNQVRVVTVSPSRGQILDRNDTVMVGSQPQEEILLSRIAAVQNPTVVAKVAALVGQTPQQVQTAVNNDQYGPYEPVPISKGVPADIVQYLQVHQADYPGVSVQTVTQRQYPQGGTTAANVLGYSGAISSTFLAQHPGQGYSQGSQVGQSGIEAEYEQYLKGINGKQVLEVNASGEVAGTLSSTAPQTGDTVVLNIDTGLQKAVEADLASQLASDRQTLDPVDNLYPAANNGAVIVMNPQNGEILAMASTPTYDLNEWVGGISAANFAALQASGAENNNAIQGLYTPGSTFKLITATADLQDGVYNPSQFYADTGKFTVPGCAAGAGADTGCVLSDDPGDSGGSYNLPQAIAASSDSYFYNLGALFWEGRATYGDDAIQNVGTQYGEGDITGIDLPDEVQGRMDSLAVRTKLHQEAPKGFPNAPTWYTGDNVEMAFGQGQTVLTPIEQAVAYATFANGGTRYQPQVASQVVNPVSGQVVKKLAPVVTGHVSLPPSIYQPILQGLEGVITNGTAAGDFQGFPANFVLAGKTGTASNQAGEEPNSWFVAFGPQPTPTYLVLAVIGQGGYGAEAAAPLVRNVFDYLLTNQIGAVKTPKGSNPYTQKAPKSKAPATLPTTTTTSPPGTTSPSTTPQTTPATTPATAPPTTVPATTTTPPTTGPTGATGNTP
jgi:penicillin-binding protein 2